jgi:hypothetical protein
MIRSSRCRTKERNHQQTVCQGGKSFGNIRQTSPERAT